MRQDAGFAAFHLAFVPPGLALLYALGFVRRAREVPAAIGPAYVAGLAVVLTPLILLLVLGTGVKLPALAAVSFVATLALGVVGWVRRERVEPVELEPPATRLETWIVRIGIGVLSVFFTLTATAFSKAPTVGDDWAFWSYKGVAFFQLDGKLDPLVFTGTDPGPAHPHYPVLQPLLESLFFRSVDDIQLQEWHVVLWVFFAAVVWTMLWLARTRGFPLLIVLIPVAALAISDRSHRIVEIGYADVTVAGFVGVGALAVGLWLNGGGARYLVLAGVVLAAAANTKNEGLVAAVAILVVAGATTIITRRGGWRPLLAAGAIFGAGVLPWMLWRGSHDIKSKDVPPLGEALEWDYLGDRFDRVPKAFSGLFDKFGDVGHWSFLVPCLLALAITCLVRGVARREAGFYLGSATLMVLGLVFVYWTGYLEIDYWLENSADRTVASVVYICAAGVIHLTALIMATIRPAATPP
ncbi:MAG: hypothetical protein M3340_04255 [Actinomycetota bacterium]|nr:hypothetical protein [Actinomycetota bacterium]